MTQHLHLAQPTFMSAFCKIQALVRVHTLINTRLVLCEAYLGTWHQTTNSLWLSNTSALRAGLGIRQKSKTFISSYFEADMWK
jgi:hypothetical protein